MVKTNTNVKTEQKTVANEQEAQAFRKGAMLGVRADMEAGKMAVVFMDGRRIDIDVSALAESIKAKAMWHGLEQKFRDAAAMPKGATLQDKFEAVQGVIETVVGGEWSSRREEREAGGLLLKALARLHPAKPKETLQAFVASKTKAEQAALRKSEKIAATIAQIQAESADGKGIDTEGLLRELE